MIEQNFKIGNKQIVALTKKNLSKKALKAILNKTPQIEDTYSVFVDYQKEDGFWVMNHETIVSVPVWRSNKKKDNHEIAKKMVEEEYRGIPHKVTKVIYH